jgi:hypothetical protein
LDENYKMFWPDLQKNEWIINNELTNNFK